ncbi:MAG: phage/plasmid primase, P4 family [Pseudomonadota bacterium]
MSWALDNLGPDRCRDIAASLFRVREEQCNGNWLRGHCPLPGHEDKNPSFGYDFANDKFKCLTPACNGYDGGDLIDLWSAINGHDKRSGFKAFKARFGQEGYTTAGRRDNRPAGAGSGGSGGSGNGKTEKPNRPARTDEFIAEETWSALPKLSEAWLQKLETQRSWSRETIQAQGLRLWRHAVSGEERVAIPVRDGQGRLRNIRKYLPGAGEGQKIKSWWEERAGEFVLFGEARLFPPAESWGPEPLWLCEGEPDCLCALSLGLNAATVTGGAGNWKPAWTEVMAGRHVIIAYDADHAGQKGARKVAQRITGTAAEVKIIAWPEYMLQKGELPKKGGQDLTDFIAKHGRARADLEALAAEAEAFHPEEANDDTNEDGGAPDDDDDRPDSPGRFWSRGADGRKSFRPARLAAEILAELDLVTDRATKVPYRWTGQYFRPVEVEDLEKVALGKLRDLATLARAKDAVGQVLTKSFLAEGMFMNPKERLLCVTNGMFDPDLRRPDQAIQVHARELLCTYQFPWSFDPNQPCDCPHWKAFLHDSIGDWGVIRELQEFFGYCLWPSCDYEMVLFLVGPGSTGKSTVLHILREMVGAENTSSVSVSDLEDQFLRSALHNKHLNIFTEADSRIFSSQYLKAISTGEPVSAAFKHRNPFDLVYRGKLAFACNRFPRVNDYSDAFYRRLLVIEMTRQIPAEERDAGLKARLAAELQGIFAWAMVGLYRLRRRGRFRRSLKSQAAVEHYRRENNPVIGFVEECITTEAQEFNAEVSVQKAALFKAYQAYCRANGYQPLAVNKFMVEFKAVAPAHKETRRGANGARERWLEGVALTMEAEGNAA